MKKIIIGFLIVIIAILLTSDYLIQDKSYDINPKHTYGIHDNSTIGIKKEIDYVFSDDNILFENPMKETYCGQYIGNNMLVDSRNYPGNYVLENTFDVVIEGVSLKEQKSKNGMYIYTIDPVDVDVYKNGGGMISFSKKEVSFTSEGINLKYNVVYDESLKKDTLIGTQTIKGTEITNIVGISYCVNNKIYPVIKITGITETPKSTIISSAADESKMIPFYFDFK